MQSRLITIGNPMNDNAYPVVQSSFTASPHKLPLIKLICPAILNMLSNYAILKLGKFDLLWLPFSLQPHVSSNTLLAPAQLHKHKHVLGETSLIKHTISNGDAARLVTRPRISNYEKLCAEWEIYSSTCHVLIA